jgi:hypothetical protein
MSDDLSQALAILNAKLLASTEKRSELEIEMRDLDVEIANLRKASASVLAAMGMSISQDISGLGITDAIRRVTGLRQDRMTANQVREELEKQGFSLTGYENPMASIYKILTRLAQANELEVEKEGSSVYYKTKMLRRSRIAQAMAKTASPAPANSLKGYEDAVKELLLKGLLTPKK